MTVVKTMTEVQSYEDHEVLESEYCSGYIDGSGKWNSGFYCSSENADGPLYCCGTATHKYCCMQKEAFSDHSNFDADLPLLFGIILGITTAVTIVMLASCCFCSCCLLYKKRQNNLNDGGPIYQMHCSSTVSGVANMYSFSVHNSMSTQSSHSVFQQLAVTDTHHVNESGEEIIGSVMDCNHPEFQNNIVPPHTFTSDGCRKNWSEVQQRAEKGHQIDTSLPKKILQCKPLEMSSSDSALPESFATIQDIPMNPIGEKSIVHSFHSYPEERGKIFCSTTNDDSATSIGCRSRQIPESSLATLIEEEVLTESQTLGSDVVLDTREVARDENLYRSTKF